MFAASFLLWHNDNIEEIPVITLTHSGRAATFVCFRFRIPFVFTPRSVPRLMFGVLSLQSSGTLKPASMLHTCTVRVRRNESNPLSVRLAHFFFRANDATGLVKMVAFASVYGANSKHV